MKKDELEIEKLAQDYFKDDSRSHDLENKLLKAIYANNEFVVRIVSKALGKYTDATSNPAELKHEAVLRTFEGAKKNFDCEQGKFINYFSRNLKFYTENILKEECKEKQELILDDPVFRKKDEEACTIETAESNTISDEKNERLLLVLLNSLNKLFLSTKAGRENKSKVYSYFVLECLLYKTDKFFNECINKYDFLNLQKEKLQEIRTDFLKTRNIPNQKDYARITGMPANKFADIKLVMEKYLREATEMQDYRN